MSSIWEEEQRVLKILTPIAVIAAIIVAVVVYVLFIA